MTERESITGELSPQVVVYLEKIVGYMNLDADQRRDVLIELAGHLEEMVEASLRKGMGREEAEQDAMRRFGDPADLAARFGSWYGMGWHLFALLSHGLVTFMFILFTMTMHLGYQRALIAGAVVAICTVAAGLWNRVHVNGKIRFYRFLRRTKVIDFESVTAVKLNRFHLFGVPAIHVQYGDGRSISYRMSWKNALCLSIVLEALVPQAVDAKFSRYLENARDSAGTNGGWRRWALTAGWLVVLAMWVPVAPMLVKMEGVSALAGIALLVACMLGGAQAVGSQNRAKSGAANLLNSGIIFMLVLMMMAGLYAFWLTPVVGVMLPIMVLGLLAVLWWPVRQRAALVSVVALSLAAGGVYAMSLRGFLSARHWTELAVVRMSGVGGSAVNAYDEGGNLIYHSLGLNSSLEVGRLKNALQTVTIKRNGETVVSDIYRLDEGSSAIVQHPTNPGEAIVILDSPYRQLSEEDDETTLTVLHVATDGTIKDREDYGKLSAATLNSVLGNRMLSPDGRFLPVWYRAGGGFSSAVLDIEKKDELFLIDEHAVGNVVDWIAPDTIRLLVNADDEGKKSGRYLLQDYHVETEETTTVRSIDVGPDFYSYRLAGSLQYHLFAREEELALVNLDTGTSMALPRRASGESWRLDWDRQNNRLAYLAQGRGEYDNELVLANPDGIVARVNVGKNQDVGIVRLSPDGRKVLFTTVCQEPWFLAFSQLKLWDVELGEIRTLSREGSISTIISSMSYSIWGNDARQWLPDSSGFIWVEPAWRTEGDTVVRMTRILQYRF